MNWREMIKRQMAVVGMTQEQLAESLEMTQGGLGHWLNGKRQPPFEKLIQIADLIGLDRAALGAALLGAHESEPKGRAVAAAPKKQRSTGSQLSTTQDVDLDLLQQIIDGQSELREGFNSVLREIRANNSGARSNDAKPALTKKQK